MQGIGLIHSVLYTVRSIIGTIFDPARHISNAYFHSGLSGALIGPMPYSADHLVDFAIVQFNPFVCHCESTLSNAKVGYEQEPMGDSGQESPMDVHLGIILTSRNTASAAPQRPCRDGRQNADNYSAVWRFRHSSKKAIRAPMIVNDWETNTVS